MAEEQQQPIDSGAAEATVQPETAKPGERQAGFEGESWAEHGGGGEDAKQAAAVIEFPDGYNRQIAASMMAHEDFETVSAAAADIKIPADLAKAISLQPNSVEIAYALAGAPEFADQFVQLFETAG